MSTNSSTQDKQVAANFLLDSVMRDYQPSPVLGLLSVCAATNEFDYYIDEGPAIIHNNIYIESKDGVVSVEGRLYDEIDELYVIFDRTDDTDYPFEYIILEINDIVYFSMTSDFAKTLDLATIGTTNHQKQIVIRLPMWFSKEFNKLLRTPRGFHKKLRLGSAIMKCVVKSNRQYTLGIHTYLLSKFHSKNIVKEIPIYSWNLNRFTTQALDPDLGTKIYDIDFELTCCEPMLTDVLFYANSKNGTTIPIKYLRLFGNNNEILSINTSQLNQNNNIYLYSHTPGKINTARFDHLQWKIEFFETPEFADIYIYARVWNMMNITADADNMFKYPYK